MYNGDAFFEGFQYQVINDNIAWCSIVYIYIWAAFLESS